MENRKLIQKAQEIRQKTFTMIYEAGGGHFGGSMSVVEILTALYYGVMNINSQKPQWEDRDRLILSKGHAGPTLYATLCSLGFFDESWLAELDHNGGRLSKHADKKIPGVDFSSGALGMGLSIANGMAMAAKLNKKDFRVYAILGDGELEEGQIWEAIMTAKKYNLNNLVAIVDRNNCQIDGTTEEVMSLEPLHQKWKDFGWNVLECEGNDVCQVVVALHKACKFKDGPTVIIANTTKGRGISFMEDTVQHQIDWHSGTVYKKEYDSEIERITKQVSHE